MLPLLLLAIFMYYTALDLYLRLSTHFLMRAKVYRYTDSDLQAALQEPNSSIQPLLLEHCHSTVQVRRHFLEVRNEYLPIINRRIRFLAIITTTGPLVGLLGTVSGMLSTFSGMVVDQGNKFDNVVEGISEALITTQTGLVISIPALIILSFIIQRRNRLERCIARLEYFNVKIAKPKLTVT
jgi:biopolymer transport protein ExbB